MVKSQQLYDRLKQKRAYEKFTKDNPSAFLYAVFCILSKAEKEGDKIQFDFYLPEKKKVGHSEYPFDSLKVQAEQTNFEVEKLTFDNVKIDLEDLWDIVEKFKKEKGDVYAINRIMGVLRKDFWDLTCTTPTLDILRIKINSESGDCIEYKKENLTNFIQIKKAQ